MITFRSSKIVYYGPHACANCGKNIAKMGTDWGGSAFTYPDGPIYPNTEWHPHVCDPQDAALMPGPHRFPKASSTPQPPKPDM